MTVVAAGASFRTHLTGGRATPGGAWRETADGMAVSLDKDSNYMSDVTADHFTYEADVRMDPAGGPGIHYFPCGRDGRQRLLCKYRPEFTKAAAFLQN